MGIEIVCFGVINLLFWMVWQVCKVSVLFFKYFWNKRGCWLLLILLFVVYYLLYIIQGSIYIFLYIVFGWVVIGVGFELIFFRINVVL